MSLEHEFKTKHHACSVETIKCNTFVCGIYELRELKQSEDVNTIDSTRQGNIIIFDYRDIAEISDIINSSNSSANHQLIEIQNIACDSGVLDMKYYKIKNNLNKYDVKNENTINGFLAVAMSAGEIIIYRYDNNNLIYCSDFKNAEEGFFLSVDWNHCFNDNYNNDLQLAVSTQNGSIIVFNYNYEPLTNTYELVVLFHIRNSHSLFNENMPVWITSFDRFSRNIVLSGGDDCKFKLWDLNKYDNEVDLKPFHISSIHSAGVTSAQWHPYKPYLFITGSYDENIAIWDQRYLKNPIKIINTGGGVWRTKWYNESNLWNEKQNLEYDPNIDYIFTASMHGGSNAYKLQTNKILNTSDIIDNLNSSSNGNDIGLNIFLCEKWIVEILHHINFKDSNYPNILAYGIDVIDCLHKNYNRKMMDNVKISGNEVDNSDNKPIFIVSSCLFYDNTIQEGLYNGISSSSFLEHTYSPNDAIITDATTCTNHHSQTNGNYELFQLRT
eukprot:gene14248-19121_t